MCLIFTLPLCLRIVLLTSIISSLISPVNVKGNKQETMSSRKLETGTEDRTCLCCPCICIIWVEIPSYLPTTTRTKLLNIAQRTHSMETELENKGYSNGRGFLSTGEHTLELAIRLMLSLTCFRRLNMLVATLIICKSTHASYLYKRWMSIHRVTRLFFKNLLINIDQVKPEDRLTSKETERIPVTPTKAKLLPRHLYELREGSTFFSIKQVMPGYELGRHQTGKGESADGPEGEYRFEANRIKSFRNWPPASPVWTLKLAQSGFYYTGKGDEVVCFSCRGHLKQWRKGDDPQDKHRQSFPSCRQAVGDDPRNVPLYERSFDETLADGMTDPFPNLAREQRSRENTGSSSSSYYGRLASALEGSGFGSQSPAGRAARPYDVEPREIKARMDTELVQLVLGLGFERLSVQNAVEQRLRNTGDDFPSAESLVEAVLNITESRRQRESQPEVPVTSPPRDSPRHQSQMPHASPEVKASDRTGEPSGKKGMSTSSVPLNPDEASKVLKEENLRLKEQRRCKICMDEEANIVFLPCGHLVSCAQCAPALRTCPICRSCIRGTVRTYN